MSANLKSTVAKSPSITNAIKGKPNGELQGYIFALTHGQGLEL